MRNINHSKRTGRGNKGEQRVHQEGKKEGRESALKDGRRRAKKRAQKEH